jgi:hypothetical protein
MSLVVGLSNNSYKPITNTAWVHARLCKLQKTVFAVDDRHVTFCDFRGGVAKIVCVTLATLAKGNFLLS